jgi:hypothetical protein
VTGKSIILPPVHGCGRDTGIQTKKAGCMETALISRENRIETLRRCVFLQGLEDSVLGELASTAEVQRVYFETSISIFSISGILIAIGSISQHNFHIRNILVLQNSFIVFFPYR